MKTATMQPHTFGKSRLSANAPPFHPTYEPASLCIFNNGVPSMVMTSEHDIAALLHGIQDQAIDENFPPTAEDAAEIEAVQAFVEMMATLAFLEEHEEEARMNFGCFEKRWEARRAQGLVGKPNPPKGLVQPKKHSPRLAKSINTLVKTSTVPLHAPKEAMIKNGKVALPRHSKHSLGRHPIQQPRKQN